MAVPFKPRLTSIGVGGFKSIKDLQPLSLNPVSVFIGANGAGKSNLISQHYWSPEMRKAKKI